MAGHLKIKSQNWIEWTVRPPSIPNYRIPSEHFLINGIKTHLTYLKSGGLFLFCESASPLKTALDIKVSAISNYCQPLQRKTRFTGRKKEIWSSNKEDPGSVTFQIVFPCDLLKGNEPNASITESPGIEECLPLSYLKKNVHFQAACRDFSKLYSDSSSSDVVINCEGKIFNAHKIVLRTRSKVFDAMLKSDMSESKTGVVNVKEIKKSIFEIFLKYLYSATLPILSISNAKDLYVVADQYDVEELKLACSEFIIKNLSAENVCEFLVFAELYNNVSLRESAVNYILQKKVPENDKNWDEFCKIHCSLANEVLNLYIKMYCSK